MSTRRRIGRGSVVGELRVAKALAAVQFDRFGRFLDNSGCQEPIYICPARLLGDVFEFKAIIQELVRVVKFVQPDIIAGIPSLGLAFSGAVSLACEIPSIIARGTPEDHGEGTALQGTYSAGQTVLVLDDATGDGTTKRACIDQLLAAGLIVTDVLVVWQCDT